VFDVAEISVCSGTARNPEKDACNRITFENIVVEFELY
jgi:hypothetical protein